MPSPDGTPLPSGARGPSPLNGPWRRALAAGLLGPALGLAGLLGLVQPDPAGAATVRVGSGANLTQIARTYGTSVHALVALNDIADPNMVLAGTVLQVPTATSAGSDPAAPSGTTSIVVSPGDSLWTIAVRYGTTVTAIAAANAIADPSRVTIGRHLTIPAAGSIGASAGGNAPFPATGQSRGLPAALLAHPTRMALIPLFHQWADAYGVPRSLLEATCWWESGWQMAVVSSTGAVGVGQLEPSTVRTLRVNLGDPTLSSASASDNIEMASAYLHQLLAQTGGNEALALAGYYQGLASVHQRGMMSSTVQYVHGILSYLPSFS
ncbi:MAG TPA: LysM peptidoglycan-binding domain-containing protein [Acidimicrobiales bacterium]|nr:LysM peptidoglycan-binding domain-containing protein [Acidimicrobiales bacterium]